MHHLRPVVLLTLVYLAFTANLELINVFVGFIIAGAVTLLLRPQPHGVIWRQIPQATLALGKYALLLVYDLVISGIKVARIVLDPALPINPGIVAIQSKCRSELATALNAHALTITPGESVVEMSEDGIMYTHCLDATQSEKIVEDAQTIRVELLERIFQ